MMKLTILLPFAFTSLIICIAAFITPSYAANQKYNVHDLGLADNAGSSANVINASCEVIGTLGLPDNAELSPAENQFFLWQRGQVITLPKSLLVTGINNKGQMVANRYPKNFDPFDFSMISNFTPVFYSNSEWESILPTNASSGIVSAVNDEGQFVGQLRITRKEKTGWDLLPALWSSKTVHLLPVSTEYTSGVARDLNNQGQVVGFLQKIETQAVPSLHNYAVLWNGKNGTTLLCAGQELDESHYGSEAIAINEKGNVLCMVYPQDNRIQQGIEGIQPLRSSKLPKTGFLWSNHKLTALIDPESHSIGIDISEGYTPRAFNNNDVVVGRATGLNGKPVAFLCQNHKMINLNTLIDPNIGWELIDAKGINDQGQIVGQGKYKGHLHAFLLTPA